MHSRGRLSETGTLGVRVSVEVQECTAKQNLPLVQNGESGGPDVPVQWRDLTSLWRSEQISHKVRISSLGD